MYSSYSGSARAKLLNPVHAEEIHDRLGCRVQVLGDSSGHMQTCSEFALWLQQLTDHILGLGAT